MASQRGQQAQLVQHGGPQLASETMHCFHRPLQQGLRIRNFSTEVFVVSRAVIFERPDTYADRRHGLADLIMQLAADAFPFLLLHMQNFIRQVSQVFLHALV